MLLQLALLESFDVQVFARCHCTTAPRIDKFDQNCAALLALQFCEFNSAEYLNQVVKELTNAQIVEKSSVPLS